MSTETVFVIGAGASKEVNLPTGYELKDQIAKLLDIRFRYGSQQTSGDFLITNALRTHVSGANNQEDSINQYLQAAHHIRKAMPQAISIDNFIDTQREDKMISLCGKLAIIRAILQAEHSSKLYFEMKQIDSTIDFNQLEDTWYTPFFRLITENCTKDEIATRLKFITLIIFNYDRCVEHFLFFALQNYYGINKADASNILKNLTIYHPYGSIGLLPWESNINSIDFGKEPTGEQLLFFSQRIKTFTESTNPEDEEILLMREKIATANKLIFLGFAFHPLNMELLVPYLPKGYNGSSPKCFATAFRTSGHDQDVIHKQLITLFKGSENTDINVENLTCVNLLKEYWRGINFNI